MWCDVLQCTYHGSEMFLYLLVLAEDTEETTITSALLLRIYSQADRNASAAEWGMCVLLILIIPRAFNDYAQDFISYFEPLIYRL